MSNTLRIQQGSYTLAETVTITRETTGYKIQVGRESIHLSDTDKVQQIREFLDQPLWVTAPLVTLAGDTYAWYEGYWTELLNGIRYTTQELDQLSRDMSKPIEPVTSF